MDEISQGEEALLLHKGQVMLMLTESFVFERGRMLSVDQVVEGLQPMPAFTAENFPSIAGRFGIEHDNAAGYTIQEIARLVLEKGFRDGTFRKVETPKGIEYGISVKGVRETLELMNDYGMNLQDLGRLRALEGKT